MGWVKKLACSYKVLRSWKCLSCCWLAQNTSTKPNDVCVYNYLYKNRWTSNEYIEFLFVFAPWGIIPECVLDDLGSLHDCTVAIFGDVYTLLSDVYNCNRGKVVMDSASARALYNVFIKSGQGIQCELIWEILLPCKIGMQHLHGHMLNEECMPFNDPFLWCKIGSDKKAGDRKTIFQTIM